MVKFAQHVCTKEVDTYLTREQGALTLRPDLNKLLMSKSSAVLKIHDLELYEPCSLGSIVLGGTVMWKLHAKTV